MRSFTVTAKDSGQRLNRYLEKLVPALYPSLMHKYLRTKRIKINGKRAEASARLSEGDLVQLYISDDLFFMHKKQPDFMRASSQLTLLFEDQNIAVIYKPAGLLVHDDSSKTADTLINRLLRYLYEKGEYGPSDSESFTPALCNRLDRGTAGIVLAAKSSAALREMNLLLKNRLITKRYLCAVTAKPPDDGTYTAWAVKDSGRNTVSVFDSPGPGAKTMITSVHTVGRKNGLWLLDVGLVTGRTHQIRAHLKHLGCPVLGDGKYGDGRINRRYNISRQALAAYEVTFNIAEHANEFPVLSYLDNTTFSLDNVWFKEEYF